MVLDYALLGRDGKDNRLFVVFFFFVVGLQQYSTLMYFMARMKIHQSFSGKPLHPSSCMLVAAPAPVCNW